MLAAQAVPGRLGRAEIVRRLCRHAPAWLAAPAVHARRARRRPHGPPGRREPAVAGGRDARVPASPGAEPPAPAGRCARARGEAEGADGRRRRRALEAHAAHGPVQLPEGVRR
jgi:hypothetical protein